MKDKSQPRKVALTLIPHPSSLILVLYPFFTGPISLDLIQQFVHTFTLFFDPVSDKVNFRSARQVK